MRSMPVVSNVPAIGAGQGIDLEVHASGALPADRSTWHCLRTVCQREKVSVRGVARRWGVKVSEVRRQLEETTDLRLSELHRWQALLGVPFGELLPEDPELALSNPIWARAQLLKVMKTVMSIQQTANQASVQRLATLLVEQLLEIMPELTEVERWHGSGAWRSTNDYGRAADCRLLEDVLYAGT